MNRSLLLAILIAVGATLWVVSGPLLSQDDGPDMQKAPAALDRSERRPDVRVRQQQAEPHTLELIINGRTEMTREVEIRAEQSGAVVKLPGKKGDVLEEGALIARLADRDRSAAVEEARARLTSRELEFNAADRLLQRGHTAETQHAAARAEMQQARAALRRAEVALEQLEVRAPFAGVLEERSAELGDFLREGDTVARLVDLDPLLVVAMVNERDIGDLSVGDRGTARLADGREAEGRLRYIARTAEEATRTFRVELAIPNPSNVFPAGVTAELRLPLEVVPAHLVSPAILVLADDGTVGVRAVDEEDRVVFHPVTIIEQRPEGVWVAGLPDEVTLITVGQEYVLAGQRVTPVDEAEVAAGQPGAGS
ncbi:efflux RND transporter periplasmic adaptor subunit [Aquibaculum sediminis]|uniref:efflux RND transporter periplasmic adaptor subunit n=1 Tax=Aquibaculum sediminis TaxID=3231907 RepID=UPI0034569A62